VLCRIAVLQGSRTEAHMQQKRLRLLWWSDRDCCAYKRTNEGITGTYGSWRFAPLLFTKS
jgi:hypothetical protein